MSRTIYRTKEGRVLAVVGDGQELNLDAFHSVLEGKAHVAFVMPPRPVMPVSNEPAEPSLLEMVQNFEGAMERWAKSGFRTVTREVFNARRSVCEACEYWDGTARFGLGKCTHRRCGCTKAKAWLATERCPENKWPS